MTDYQRAVEDRWVVSVHAAACREAVATCDWDARQRQYVLVTSAPTVKTDRYDAMTTRQLGVELTRMLKPAILRVKTYTMCGSRCVSLFWRGTCVCKVAVRTMARKGEVTR